MAEVYVEYGYNEPGYVEGDDGLSPGTYNLRFFLETYGADESEILAFVNEAEENIALIIGVDGQPMRVVTSKVDRVVASAVTEELQSQLDEMTETINEITGKVNFLYDGNITVEELDARIQEISNALNEAEEKTISIVSDSGDVVATTVGYIGDGGALRITVPEEVVATEYTLVISSSSSSQE